MYRGQKTKFWLPRAEQTLLLETPQLKIFAIAFSSPYDEDLQWFDSFVLTLPDDSELARVNVRRGGLRALNKTSSQMRRKRYLQSMEIYLGTSRVKVEVVDDQLNKQHTTPDRSVIMKVGSQMHHSANGLGMPRDYLYVYTDSIAFFILASHAGNEFRRDIKRAVAHMHLDFLIDSTVGEEHFKGLLPQLWGLQPRSDEVEDMLFPPSQLKLMAVANSSCETIVSAHCGVPRVFE